MKQELKLQKIPSSGLAEGGVRRAKASPGVREPVVGQGVGETQDGEDWWGEHGAGAQSCQAGSQGGVSKPALGSLQSCQSVWRERPCKALSACLATGEGFREKEKRVLALGSISGSVRSTKTHTMHG